LLFRLQNFLIFTFFYFHNYLWTNLLWYYGSRNHHSMDRKPYMCIHYPNLQCSISWYYKWQFEILDGKIMPKQGTYNYAPANVDSLNAEEASNLKVNDVSRWDCWNASHMQHLSEHTIIRIIEIPSFFNFNFLIVNLNYMILHRHWIGGRSNRHFIHVGLLRRLKFFSLFTWYYTILQTCGFLLII
jgi:hypothetical protein